MRDPREKLPPLKLPAGQEQTHKIELKYHHEDPSFAEELARLVAEGRRAPDEQTLSSETTLRLRDGKLDGQRRGYYPTGTLWYDETWRDGKLWSLDADFFPDGRPVDGCFVSEGCGHQKIYYNNGVLKTEGALKDGQRQGYWINLYQSGVRQSEGGYVDGTQRGAWRYYNERGELTATDEFEEEGVFQRRLWPDMKIKSEGYLIKNPSNQWIYTGLWRSYDEQGRETITEYDDQGKVVTKKGR